MVNNIIYTFGYIKILETKTPQNVEAFYYNDEWLSATLRLKVLQSIQLTLECFRLETKHK